MRIACLMLVCTLAIWPVSPARAVTAADLTYVGGGSGNLNDTLGSVARLAFRHQSGAPAGANTTTPITGILGSDNITALPEPAAALLLLAGAALWGRPNRTADARGE